MIRGPVHEMASQHAPPLPPCNGDAVVLEKLRKHQRLKISERTSHSRFAVSQISTRPSAKPQATAARYWDKARAFFSRQVTIETTPSVTIAHIVVQSIAPPPTEGSVMSRLRGLLLDDDGTAFETGDETFGIAA